MPIDDPWPYVNPPTQVVQPQSWPWPKPTDCAPSCQEHLTPMRWAAKHGASKGHWHCDECHKSRKHPF